MMPETSFGNAPCTLLSEAQDIIIEAEDRSAAPSNDEPENSPTNMVNKFDAVAPHLEIQVFNTPSKNV